MVKQIMDNFAGLSALGRHLIAGLFFIITVGTPLLWTASGRYTAMAEDIGANGEAISELRAGYLRLNDNQVRSLTRQEQIIKEQDEIKKELKSIRGTMEQNAVQQRDFLDRIYDAIQKP